MPERSATPADAGSAFAALLREWRAAATPSPLIMGILNVTPDSFSDGGLLPDPDAAVARGRLLLAEGAAIVDVGGESTRATASRVDASEERDRILPAIRGLVGSGLISVDTMKAAVAEDALAAGAAIVNDVRGLQGDPDMAAVAARHGAGVVVMHNPGVLGSTEPLAGDPVAACTAFFERSLEIARRAGIAEDRVTLDPGFGFGKAPEQNLEILARLGELRQLGFPLLVGTSRKAFIGRITGGEPHERLVGTLVTNLVAALADAAIIRVHDVAAHRDALRMLAAIRAAAPRRGRAER